MTNNTYYLDSTELKLARVALNLSVREMGKLIGVSGTTIHKIETFERKVKNLIFAERRNNILLQFFQENGITFKDHNLISFSPPSTLKIQRKRKNGVLTRFQFRVARHILNKTHQEIADMLGTNRAIIARAEVLRNEEFLRPQDLSIVDNMKNLFIQHEICFPDNFSIFFKKKY